MHRADRPHESLSGTVRVAAADATRLPLRELLKKLRLAPLEVGE